MIRFAICAAVLTTLGGCAATATWQHPSRAGDGHDGATMALAECQRYASGTGPAPMPTAQMDMPAPTSYTTRGTYTQYGSYGTYSGTTTANGGFASNFAAGYNAGAALGDAIASAQFQKRINEITAACMRSQGWIDSSSLEGQTKLKQAIAQKQVREANVAEADAANDKWVATINTFVETEAARPGGIDYRTDKRKQSQLDKYVKQLANDPKNNNQSSAWYLIEAHKKVLAWDASYKRWADAYSTLFQLEAARSDGIAYRVDEKKAAALEKQLDLLTNDLDFDDWKEIDLLIFANKLVRRDHGLPP